MLIQFFFRLFVSINGNAVAKVRERDFFPLLVFYSDCDLTRNGRNADNSHCAGWKIE